MREAERSRMYHLPKPRKLIIREADDLEGDELSENDGAQQVRLRKPKFASKILDSYDSKEL